MIYKSLTGRPSITEDFVEGHVPGLGQLAHGYDNGLGLNAPGQPRQGQPGFGARQDHWRQALALHFVDTHNDFFPKEPGQRGLDGAFGRCGSIAHRLIDRMMVRRSA